MVHCFLCNCRMVKSHEAVLAAKLVLLCPIQDKLFVHTKVLSEVMVISMLARAYSLSFIAYSLFAMAHR